MTVVILMRPEFHQTEDNKIDGNIGVTVLEIGTKNIPLETSQKLVAYEDERALVEVYDRIKINDELSIIMLVNEEGSFYYETPVQKLDNGEKLSDTDLKWLPWSSPMFEDPRPVFGSILIVKMTKDNWCCLEQHEVAAVMEYLQGQQELKANSLNK